jgi:uncharacterized protein YfaP (DUF2135 family)
MPFRNPRGGSAVVLATLAANGFPHLAFLSPEEVAFRAGVRVAVSVPAASRTAANLEARRKATLFFDAGRVLRFVRARRRVRSRVQAADPRRRLFVLDLVAEEVPVPLAGESGRFVRPLAFVRTESAAKGRARRRVAAEVKG